MASRQTSRRVTWVAGALMGIATAISGPASAQNSTGWQIKVEQATKLLAAEDARRICADNKNPNITDENYVIACVTFFHAFLSNDDRTKNRFATRLRTIRTALENHGNTMPFELVLPTLSREISAISSTLTEKGQPDFDLGEIVLGIGKVVKDTARGAKGSRYESVSLQ